MKSIFFDRWCSAAVGRIHFVPDRWEVYEELYPTWRKVYDAQLRLSDEHVTRYMWSAPGV